MRLAARPRVFAFTAIAVTGVIAAATAQPAAADQDRPNTTVAQAMPPSGMGQGSGAQSSQPGMGQGMMGGRPMAGMRGHMQKLMFAIADTNSDGGLSFDEVTAIHRRIFDQVDANRDGKVTPEEVQAFMRE